MTLRRHAAARACRMCLLLAAAAPPACSPRPSPAPASPALLSTPEESPWSFAGTPGRMVRTTWYRLFTTDTDPGLQRHMPEFLERCLDRYTSELAILPRPPFKLDTFLMQSRDEWERLTRQVMGEQAPPYLRIQRGGFASGGRALLWSIGRRATFAITAHEGWHQYTQRTFREQLPAWAEEGIAVYMEGFTPDDPDPARPRPSPWANLERFDRLRAAAAAHELIPLAELLAVTPDALLAAPPQHALTCYAQLWALLLHLREDPRTAAALSRLLQDAAAGRTARAVALSQGKLPGAGPAVPAGGREVFEAYFGSAADFEPGYAGFLRRLVAMDRAEVATGRP
jgi:hypothetical protein